MLMDKLETAKTTWREISKHTTNDSFSLELEVHKHLFNIFQVGNFYYYIFNCNKAKIEYVSDSFSAVLGHDKSFFCVENLAELLHPDDFSYFIDFETKVTSFFTQLPADQVMAYKVSYDYRMKHANGTYLRLLHQAVAIQSDANGSVLRVLGIHTDISRLKKENGSTLSFIGLKGQQSFENVCIGVLPNPKRNFVLSAREKEILQYLQQAKTSAEIGSCLFISKATVDRYRKNMLKKTNSKSTAELSIRSIQENWT